MWPTGSGWAPVPMPRQASLRLAASVATPWRSASFWHFRYSRSRRSAHLRSVPATCAWHEAPTLLPMSPVFRFRARVSCARSICDRLARAYAFSTGLVPKAGVLPVHIRVVLAAAFRTARSSRPFGSDRTQSSGVADDSRPEAKSVRHFLTILLCAFVTLRTP